jgi:hypothetical protein
MNIMTIRRKEMNERNLENMDKNINISACFEKRKPTKRGTGFDKIQAEKPLIDYSDFNGFIDRIKNEKTKKNKLNLMLEFINQEAKEINKTIL